MDTQAIASAVAVRNALLAAFHGCGMRPMIDADQTILTRLTALGITASASAGGYLELSQSGTPMVVSKVCEAIRTQNPELFVSDVRWDAVCSREDFHGSPTEVTRAKAQYIAKFGLAAYEQLPATRAAAELRSVTPSADMNRAQYLSLSRAEKAQLLGVIGADGVSKIMTRVK